MIFDSSSAPLSSQGADDGVLVKQNVSLPFSPIFSDPSLTRSLSNGPTSGVNAQSALDRPDGVEKKAPLASADTYVDPSPVYPLLDPSAIAAIVASVMQGMRDLFTQGMRDLLVNELKLVPSAKDGVIKSAPSSIESVDPVRRSRRDSESGIAAPKSISTRMKKNDFIAEQKAPSFI